MRATLKLDPENPYALPNLAHLLLRRGAVTDALTVYRRLGKAGPAQRRASGWTWTTTRSATGSPCAPPARRRRPPR